MKKTLSASVASVLAVLSLAGCSFGGGNTDATVNGAKDATSAIASFVATRAISYRPAALVGIYASIFYANGEYLPVASARSGVMAQVQFHSRPSEESMENTYALMEEFGTILQIDVPDLLNRSTDRADTLNQYVQGLTNITTRAERRLDEAIAYISTLRDQQREAKRSLNDANRAARKALDEGDFALAAEKQQEVNDWQTKAAKADGDIRQFTEIKQYLEKLIEVAHARLQAIDENREVLIAGLRVVDVPGADDIGVLNPAETRRSRSTDSGLFGEP